MEEDKGLGARLYAGRSIAMADDTKVVIVGDVNDTVGLIDVDGVKYRQKKRESFPKTQSKILTMMSMFSAFDPYLSREKQFNAPKVDIVSEYKLIRQKKSNLTKSQRDWVVHQFELNFELVSNKQN